MWQAARWKSNGAMPDKGAFEEIKRWRCGKGERAGGGGDGSGGRGSPSKIPRVSFADKGYKFWRERGPEWEVPPREGN